MDYLVMLMKDFMDSTAPTTWLFLLGLLISLNYLKKTLSQ